MKRFLRKKNGSGQLNGSTGRGAQAPTSAPLAGAAPPIQPPAGNPRPNLHQAGYGNELTMAIEQNIDRIEGLLQKPETITHISADGTKNTIKMNFNPEKIHPLVVTLAGQILNASETERTKHKDIYTPELIRAAREFWYHPAGGRPATEEYYHTRGMESRPTAEGTETTYLKEADPRVLRLLAHMKASIQFNEGYQSDKEAGAKAACATGKSRFEL